MVGVIQYIHMEDNEPIGIPAALSDFGNLYSHHVEKALAHLPSCLVTPAQRQDCKIPPQHLPPSIIYDPSVDMIPFIYMNPFSRELLYLTVHQCRNISPEIHLVLDPLTIQCYTVIHFSVLARHPLSIVGCSPLRMPASSSPPLSYFNLFHPGDA